MRHLEQITGGEGLRDGLRGYLKKYSYGNADWNNLISIIDSVTGKDLKQWSNAWVREAGMPIISPLIRKDGKEFRITFSETDPSGKRRDWPQTMMTKIVTDKGVAKAIMTPGDTNTFITLNGAPRFVIPDTTGMGYGCFITDTSSLRYIKANPYFSPDPLVRGTIWVNLNEQMLNGRLDPEVLYSLMLASLQEEKELQLQTYLSGRISFIFLNRFDNEKRNRYGRQLEDFAWARVSDISAGSQRRTWFALFRNTALTRKAMDQLFKVWQTGELPGKTKLSDDELSTLAFNLAVKDYPGADSVLSRQYRRLTNPDLKKKLAFIAPAVSGSEQVRDAFFESLKKAENREQEPWVIEALGYLHYPLREASSEKYILPSLEMLEEIKATGDIFFPASWLSATLEGHHSEAAKEIVKNFLITHPGYPENLKLKILQAGDQLMRE